MYSECEVIDWQGNMQIIKEYRSSNDRYWEICNFFFSEYRPGATHLLRTRREERPLEHGCLCHRTTVAVGALSQYVRFILEFIALQKGHVVA